MQKNSTTTNDIASSSSPETRPDTTTTDVRQPRRHRGLRVLAMLVGMMLVVMAFAAGVWTVARSTDSRTETLSPTIDQIVVEGINGWVTFEAGAETKVTVEREWLFTTAPEVEIAEEEGILHISADCGALCRTNLSGTVPAGAGIFVRTNAGNVEITGLEGGVDLATSAGNVTVTDIGGPAVLRTEAGWIRGDISDGDVDAQTSAGGIDLEIAGDFSRVAATSDAGFVRLAVPDDVYRVEADTSAGFTQINVATDPNAARVIVARSSAGNVTVDRIRS